MNIAEMDLDSAGQTLEECLSFFDILLEFERDAELVFLGHLACLPQSVGAMALQNIRDSRNPLPSAAHREAAEPEGSQKGVGQEVVGNVEPFASRQMQECAADHAVGKRAGPHELCDRTDHDVEIDLAEKVGESLMSDQCAPEVAFPRR